MDNIATIVLATGALGTAAFGIVEALKVFRWLGEAGFGSLLNVLGPIMELLKVAYGPDVDKLLRAQYRGNCHELTRVMRQGARIGLTEKNAAEIAAFIGMADTNTLKAAAREVEAGHELPPELRNVLGRFELAIDARIDAAITLALDHYGGEVRIAASTVAVVIALAVGAYLQLQLAQPGRIFQGVLIGVAAVPLAPVAKDLVTALKSAADALRARG